MIEEEPDEEEAHVLSTDSGKVVPKPVLTREPSKEKIVSLPPSNHVSVLQSSNQHQTGHCSLSAESLVKESDDKTKKEKDKEKESLDPELMKKIPLALHEEAQERKAQQAEEAKKNLNIED